MNKNCCLLIICTILCSFLFLGIPVGSNPDASMYLFWGEGAIPTGWSLVSDSGGDFYNVFVRGSNSYGGTGGATTHNHTLSASWVRDSEDPIGGFVYTDTTPDEITIANEDSDYGGPHIHNLINLTVDAASNMPQYSSLKVIKYDSGIPDTIPMGAIALFETTNPPTGWEEIEDYGYYIYCSDSVGSTGGSSDAHIHSLTVDCGPPTTTNIVEYASPYTAVSSSTHTHDDWELYSYGSKQPPTISVIFAQKVSETEDGVSDGLVAMFDDTLGTEWEVRSGIGDPYYERLLVTWNSFGTTYGSETHNHEDVRIISGYNAEMSTVNEGSYAFAAIGTHRHVLESSPSADTSTDSHMPPYLNVIFAKRYPNPHIVDWWNSQTDDDEIYLEASENETIDFNATADQDMDSWTWVKNGTDQSHDYANFTTTFHLDERLYENWTSNNISTNNWTTGGDANWSVVYDDNHFSARSGDIDDSETTWLNHTLEAWNSSLMRVSFYWMVNSEAGHDTLSLYADGELLDSISGDVPWAYTWYILDENTSELSFEYAKDGGGTTGADAGWVDDLIIEAIQTVSVNATNDNGTTNTVTWYIASRRPVFNLVKTVIDCVTKQPLLNFTAICDGVTELNTTDGSITFDNLTFGWHIINASVIGYYSGVDSIFVDEDTSLENSLVSINASGGSGVYYPAATATFRVISFMGVPYEGINVTATPLSITSSSWDWLWQVIGLSAQSANLIQLGTLNGLTDANGEIVFAIAETVKYQVTFIDEITGINKTISIYPKNNMVYTVYIWSTDSELVEWHSFVTNCTINITTETIDTTHAYINISYSDTSSGTAIINYTINISEISGLSNETTVATGSEAGGATINISEIVENYRGNMYYIYLNITHSEFGELQKTYSAKFRGVRLDLGFSDFTYLLISVCGIFLTGLVFGSTSADYGALITCMPGWMFYSFGWFDPLGYSAPLVLAMATVVSILYIIVKRGHEEGYT